MKKILILLFMTVSSGLLGQSYSRNKKEIAKEIKAHNKAVHIFDDWMR